MDRIAIESLLAGLTRFPRDPALESYMGEIEWLHGERTAELLRPAMMRAPLFRGLVATTPDGSAYLVSMQGSAYHYSSPKADLASLTEYQAVEVALLEDGLHFRPLSRLGFGLADPDDDDDVWGYMPVGRLIDELTRFCERGGSLEPELGYRRGVPASHPLTDPT